MHKTITPLLLTLTLLGCGVGTPEPTDPGTDDRASLDQHIEACQPGHGGPTTCEPGPEGDFEKCPWPGAYSTNKSCYVTCWDPMAGYYRVRRITDWCIPNGSPAQPQSVSRVVIVQ
ncbi:MAG: hypothetical protein K1X89_28535 [Myxococcaceae bacterium]|nr:hypothetical protein [Myxococcaceae bacterium]